MDLTHPRIACIICTLVQDVPCTPSFVIDAREHQKLVLVANKLIEAVGGYGKLVGMNICPIELTDVLSVYSI